MTRRRGCCQTSAFTKGGSLSLDPTTTTEGVNIIIKCKLCDKYEDLHLVNETINGQTTTLSSGQSAAYAIFGGAIHLGNE